MKSNKTGIWHYIKNFRFNSIFIKNLLVIFILVFLPLSGLSVAVYSYLNGMARQEATSSNLHEISRARDIVDMVVSETERLSMRLATDSELDYIVKTEIEDFPKFETIEKLQNISNRISVSNITSDYIASIYIYSELNEYIITTDKGSSDLAHFSDLGWQPSYEEKKNDSRYWIEYRRIENSAGQNQSADYMSYYRIVPIYENRILGFVAINIDLDKLGKLLGSYNGNSAERIYIIDEDGYIVYNSDYELIGKKMDVIYNIEDFLPNGQEVAITAMDKINVSVASTYSDYNKWRFVSIVPLQELYNKTSDLKSFMALFIIMSFIFIIIISFFISIRIFAPIKSIISTLENPEKLSGLVKNEDEKQNLDELKYIINNIVTTFDENKKMEDELEHRLELLKRAQTIALQSQINPHFLFNTLETINWLSIKLTEGKNNDVTAIIASFSKLLRLSFATQDHLVKIEDELEHGKMYLEILKVRYEDKFDVIWEVDEKTFEYKTVKLTLQPLIENAIYHGVKPNTEKCHIWIKTYFEDENIVLEVSDDGVGIDEKTLKNLITNLENDYIKEDQHIGISNVNQRVKLIFGSDYGIQIASKIDKGTTIRIITPKIM